MSGQNCDGALLTARPLSGHAHPVRRQQAPPQATADRSEPRHVSQLRCESDHDLERHAGDPHSQTTTWGRHTPILTVALCEAGAGEIVDPRWSDRQGQLVEGSQDPEVYYFLSSKFVVSAADILDERVPGSDHSCAAKLFEATHRPQSGL